MTSKELDNWLTGLNDFKKEVYETKDIGHGNTATRTQSTYRLKNIHGHIRLDHVVTVCRDDKRGNILWRSNYWTIYAKGKSYTVENKISKYVPQPEDIELILKLIKI